MRKKIILWGLGFIFLLLLAFLLTVPAFIDSSSLKQKIQTAVIQKNIGEIDYQKASLSFIPLPHLTIEKISFSSHERAKASVEKMKIYPELLPLFEGRLRISKIVLDAPDLTAILSNEHEKKREAGKETTPFNLADSLASAIEPLTAYTSDLKVSIDQGYFKLNEGGQQKFLFNDVELNARLNITDPRSFKAQLNINGATLTINQGDRKIAINCDSLDATLHVDESQVLFSLADLHLAQPALDLSGRFITSPNTTNKSGFSLDLNGRDLDVKAIRTAALVLVGDNETVRDIFSYVKGGRIPTIRVQSKSKSMATLGEPDNIIIQGRMQKGNISIDDIGLQLTEVDGDVLISKGLLQASGASARLGETTGRDGSMKIGLAHDNDTFHLDVMLNAELNQVPAVLKKIIDHEAIVRELSLIKNLKGTAKARLVLGEDLDKINTTLEVSEIDFSADYQRVPFPIKLNRGKLFFTENKISAEGLDGNVGKSIFSEISCNVEWENGFNVDIPAGRLNLDLGELYPWVSSFDALREDLADVKEVKGNFELSALTLIAPWDVNGKPEPWQLSAAGEVQKIAINAAQLPETLYLSSGKIQKALNQLLFQNLEAQLMDAKFYLTGTLMGDIRPPDHVNVSLEGNLGEKALSFLAQTDHLPAAYAVHAPIQFSKTSILWQSADDFSFTGNVFFPKDVQISTDFNYQTGELAINRLDIQDQDSKATLALDLQKNKINLLFNGYLNNKTLDRIFVAEKMSDGWLKGDLQMAFVKGKLSESTMKGQLEGGDFMIPVTESAPVFIDKLLFAAKNNKIDVNQLSLSYLDNQVELKGQADMTADTVMLDLDASAGDLKWDVSEKTSGEPAKGPTNNSRIDFGRYPVSGIINLSAKSFSLGVYKWQPVHAKISRDQGRIKIDVTEANLCGIDTLGTLQSDGKTLDLDFQCTAKNRDISFTYECLSKNQIEMTGLYKLSGQISAHGPADELLSSAQGKFDFKARNGVITQDKKLSRILEVVNFTEIVKGRIPDLTSEGFSYKTITVEGEFKNNVMIFKKLYMDGKTLDILGKGTLDLKQDILDVELMAAPFKTVDTAIKFIPGVNYLMAGNLVSIPVRVKGNRADPEVSIMSASDISSSFLDFAERTINSPIKLIKDLNPYKKSEPQ